MTGKWRYCWQDPDDGAYRFQILGDCYCDEVQAGLDWCREHIGPQTAPPLYVYQGEEIVKVNYNWLITYPCLWIADKDHAFAFRMRWC